MFYSRGTKSEEPKVTDNNQPLPPIHPLPGATECESLPKKQPNHPLHALHGCHHTHCGRHSTETTTCWSRISSKLTTDASHAAVRCFGNTSQIHLESKTKYFISILWLQFLTHFSQSRNLLPHICISTSDSVRSKITSGCNSEKLFVSWRWTQQLSRTEDGRKVKRERERDRQIQKQLEER